MKKISLIVPIYNCQEYLEECFESICEQSIGLSQIEVILINDGSKDNSVTICKSYADKYNWIFIDRKDNHGLAYTRNEGIKNSHSNYIVFLDSDDLLYTNALESLFNNINKYKSDIAISKINAFNSKGEYGYYSDKYLKTEKCFYLKDNVSIINCISACGKIYKKSTISKIKFLENTYHEDNSFSLEVLLKGKKISILPEYTYYRRIREGDNKSIMQNLNSKTFIDLLKNFISVKNNNNGSKFLNDFMFRKSLNYIIMNIDKSEQRYCKKEFKKFFEYVFLIDNYKFFQKNIVMIKYKIYYILGNVYKFLKRN